MPRRAGRAVVGGTFDRIHRGHVALFDAVFRVSRTVGIGLTTRAFLARHPKPLGRRIRPFGVRRRALVRFLRERYPGRAWEILPLESAMGGAVEPDVDAIVVSEETARVVPSINRERRRRGVRPLRAIVVGLVHGDDLVPISGRRIRAGIVRPDGLRRVPLVIAVSATDRRSLPLLQDHLTREFEGVRVRFRVHPWPRTGRKPARDPWRVAQRIRGTAEYAFALVAEPRGASILAESTVHDGAKEIRSRGGRLGELVHRLVGSRRGIRIARPSHRAGPRGGRAPGRRGYVGGHG